MLKKTVIISSLLLTTASFSAGDITAPQVPEILENRGILKECNDSSFVNLQDFITSELLKHISAKKGEDKIAQKTAKLAIPLLEFSAEKLKKAENQNFSIRRSAYIQAKRVIYSIEAKTAESRRIGIFEALGILKKIDTHMPYIAEEDRDKPIGEFLAAKESKFLISNNDTENLTITDLASMSVNEIAKLGVSNNHPGWHSEKYLKNQTESSWTKIEKWSEKMMKKVVKKKIGKAAAKEYTLGSAKKVLFFDKIKTSATSPKINTTDSYGQKWKLKWGNEVQVEPLANRIYLKLGAKFADLVYSNGPGIEGTVLILGDPKTSGNCIEINSYKLMKDCLMSSNYKFDLTPYVKDHGLISKENVDSILKNLPKNGLEKLNKEALIDRTYITFHESMVEFKGKKISSYGGPVPGSFFGANEDRVFRSLLIFDMWIWNLDSKDENNKNIIVKGLHRDEKEYIEYQHDLGASLGGVGMSGGADMMSDSRYVKQNKNSIEFNQFMLYRPKAWKNISFADGLWMATKIVALRKSDFKEILTHTKWPDFYQKVFARKLMARRNELADAFDISKTLPASEKDLDINDITIDLSTREARENVARKYNLKRRDIRKMMVESGLIKNGKSNYKDKVVRKNKIVSCEESIIVNLMEAGPNPSGIKRRIQRAKDYKPLEACDFHSGLKLDGDESML